MAATKMRPKEFCPACIGRGGGQGSKYLLDENNLAYQIVVRSEETDITKLLENTVLQLDASRLFISSEDEVQKAMYGPQKKIYFLKPEDMKYVLNKIEGKIPPAPTVENELMISAADLKDDPNAAPSAGRNSVKPKKDNMIPMSVVKVSSGPKAGCFKFLKDERLILEAYPCCPGCHVVLPKGWFSADEYVDIGLVAPTEGGKTTYLTTLAKDDWMYLAEWFYKLGYTDVDIEDGNTSEEILEPGLFLMRKEGERMDQGICPAGTPAKFGKRKIYISFWDKKKKKRYIVGLCDIAGEILESLGTDGEIQIHGAGYPHCDAYIYFVEPKMIPAYVEFASEDKNQKTDQVNSGRLMPIDEQGRFQVQNSSIKAVDVAESGEAPAEVRKPFAMYDILIKGIQSQYASEERSTRPFAFVMTKGDLLKKYLTKENGMYNMLFIPDEDETRLSPTFRATVNTQEKQVLLKLIKVLRMNRLRNFSKVSYHVISPLGRDTVKKMVQNSEGKLVPEYRMKKMPEYDDFGPHPIRIADPLFACILPILKFEENEQ